MADKKITDLNLRSDVSDTCNFPTDDNAQTFRVTAVQIKNYIMTAVNEAISEALSGVDSVRTGTIHAYGGVSAPTGYLICDGSEISRSTYANLFSVIGTAFGNGNGSTTFRVPDFRGRFLRGKIESMSATGSGTVSSNNATFTAHGYNRTGMPVRMWAGTLTGLNTTTTYYVIVVDENTLAFATTPANAFAGTKISISGTNAAFIHQWENPDISNRFESAPGSGDMGDIGSYEVDGFQSHSHTIQTYYYDINQANSSFNRGCASNVVGSGSPSTSFTGSSETRPKNVFVNYIIKT